MKCSEDGEGAGVERRRPGGDEGARTVTAFEDPHGGKKSNAGTQAGSADLELAGEVTLWRKAIPRANLSRTDKRANVFDDLHGELAVAGYLVDLLFDLFFHSE